MDASRVSTAEADLSPADPEAITALEPSFPDGRQVVLDTLGLTFGPDVRFTLPNGQWVTVETIPMTTGVAFQVVLDHDPTEGGTVFISYDAAAEDRPAAADVARALRTHGLSALPILEDRAPQVGLSAAVADLATDVEPLIA